MSMSQILLEGLVRGGLSHPNTYPRIWLPSPYHPYPCSSLLDAGGKPSSRGETSLFLFSGRLVCLLLCGNGSNADHCWDDYLHCPSSSHSKINIMASWPLGFWIEKVGFSKQLSCGAQHGNWWLTTHFLFGQACRGHVFSCVIRGCCAKRRKWDEVTARRGVAAGVTSQSLFYLHTTRQVASTSCKRILTPTSNRD